MCAIHFPNVGLSSLRSTMTSYTAPEVTPTSLLYGDVCIPRRTSRLLVDTLICFAIVKYISRTKTFGQTKPTWRNWSTLMFAGASFELYSSWKEPLSSQNFATVTMYAPNIWVLSNEFFISDVQRYSWSPSTFIHVLSRCDLTNGVPTPPVWARLSRMWGEGYRGEKRFPWTKNGFLKNCIFL